MIKRLFVLALAAAACGAPKPQQPDADAGNLGRPAGIYSSPAQLAFTCVTPSCDETITARITVSGDRRVAIKRILMEGAAMGDFSFSSSERAPFVVGAGAGFDIDVRYQPKGAPVPGTVTILITYTDASAEETDDRLPPGELKVPLLRRLVGSPVLAINPTTLSFGVVMNGSSKTLPLHLSNTGFGNIALEVTGVDAGENTELQATLPAQRSMLSDAGIDIPVTWNPLSPGYLRSSIEVFTSAPEAPSGSVFVDGTSLANPRLAIEPADTVDFGEVARTKDRKLPIVLVNQGGADLSIAGITSTDVTGNLTASTGDGGVVKLDGTAMLTIKPLQRVPMVLTLNGITAGDLHSADGGVSQVLFNTNDPDLPEHPLTVKGTVTQPKIGATPGSIAFGTIPQGWVVNKPVQLRNVGFGTLTVKNLSFVGGTSQLYGLINKPALPVEIRPGEIATFDVEFRAETNAPATGSVSVESDDPDTRFIEIPLTASVADCSSACPITNGTPSCTMGVCKVGMCNANWYDTDGQASNGCECAEATPGGDPGSFCATAKEIGTLKDTSGQSASVTGNIPTAMDVDVIHFYAEDATNVFGDDYDVRISLNSSDPGIKMCISRQGSGSSQGCSLGNEDCPASRSYRQDGSLGQEDGSDFAIRIFRDASSPPVCTQYTVLMSNG